ncbi:MAG TPA: hypothetical protein VE377_24195 [Candidatus Dormibacteraeota bacterium]|nr:hypothetical protein [Candidatus Dormibacteraeota bacterium]
MPHVTYEDRTGKVSFVIPVNELVKGKVYRLNSRGLSCGVWNGEEGFVGIRTKFGNRFLDKEIHWDLSDHSGERNQKK